MPAIGVHELALAQTSSPETVELNITAFHEFDGDIGSVPADHGCISPRLRYWS